MQRNWIGRSEGRRSGFAIAECGLRSAECEKSIRVFTTRPDTLFGATYMVLAPEHQLVDAITTPAQRQAVEAYKAEVAKKSDLERTELAKEKTGVFTGAYAINPVNGQKIPIWIADYVLISYGTGAIMAVPGHDTRDFEFATKFNLPIVQVVEPPAGTGLARLRRRRHLRQLRRRRDFDQRPAHTRGQAQDHRLAGIQGAGQEDHQLQAARLALQPPALLGRAVPDRLEDRRRRPAYHEALPESALPLLAAAARRLQAHPRRPAAARPRAGLGQPARRLQARDQHHAPMGRQLLVLPPLPRCAERPRLLRPRGGAILDGQPRTSVRATSTPNAPTANAATTRAWTSTSAAPSTPCCTCSTPGSGTRCCSTRPCLDAGTVLQARQPGPDPRRRRPEDVQVPRQRHQPRRHPRRVRRRRVPALRDVHGPAGNGEALEHQGRRRRLSFPRPRLAPVRGRAERDRVRAEPRPPTRSAAPSCWSNIRLAAGIKDVAADRRPAQGAARLHQESDRGPRRPALQHRHLRPDGLHQRSDDLGSQAGLRPARLPDPAPALRAAPRRGTLVQASRRHALRSTLPPSPTPPGRKFDPALLVEDTLEIPVQVNGKLRDVIKVPANASQADWKPRPKHPRK